ncbi:MAG: pseudaminic acid biosynthesis-associated methylase [Candidatus Aureabacteria bacterium]|nr:pseudaminic acid biosynthesis-associated methylase [Candidatus Auribacterota bacterium]
MKKYNTEQEKFWAGRFGDEYSQRNQGKNIIASNTALFTKILSKTNSISSIIEMGANIGLNLIAIKTLLPGASITALEINPKAVKELKKIPCIKVYNESMLEYIPDRKWDLVLSKGVLIHQNPDKLEKLYQLMYDASKSYICIAEYYNPSPVEIPYRGHKNKLFKRDFAGEMMDAFPDLKLIDYGFVYHRDNNFPQDDITWFLLKKLHF